MRTRFALFVVTVAILANLIAICHAETKAGAIVIVIDGLRPDYVTSELMPVLHGIGKRGVVCKNHHAVFPTVTRVNSSSFSTGSYPARHGILGNTIYIPEVDAEKPISTGSAKNLMLVDSATAGKVLTAPTLGEILDSNGMKLFVASSGSSGSAFLLNSKVAGGGIVNSEMVLPESAQSAVESRFGGEPPEAMPQIAGNRRAIDALLQLGLDEHKADALFLWITDPDNTAHTKGVGTPETLAALKHVDEEVGRIFDSILAKGLADRYNILITSDHGFSTHSGPGNLNQLLVQGGVKKSLASTDVIVAEGAIYVDDSDTAKIAAIVELLQRTPWIGPVFTAARSPGETLGSIPGTLSFDSIAWNHARSGDILTCATWVDDANEAGWKGITAQSGTAGHGTSSPYDIHNTLIAVGPDIKEGIASEVPTANVDIAPTIAHILGISPAPTMDGRVMSEILRGGPSPSSISVTKKVDRTERKLENSTYQVELHRTLVEGRYYLDYTVTRRSIP